MPESVVYNPADAPPGEREELYVKSILAIARDDLGRVVGREEIDTFHWDANTPPETTRQKVAMHVAVVGDSAPATVEWQIRGNPDRSPNDLTETLIVGLTLPVDTLEVRRIGEACAEAQNECERGAVCSGGSCEAIETPPDAVLRFHRATMKAELLGSVFGDAANAWIAADGDDECDAAPASLYRLQPTEFALPGAYLPEAETVWAMVTGGPWYRVPVQVVDQ